MTHEWRFGQGQVWRFLSAYVSGVRFLRRVLVLLLLSFATGAAVKQTGKIPLRLRLMMRAMHGQERNMKSVPSVDSTAGAPYNFQTLVSLPCIRR
jgi:hypothetical protein